MPNFKVEAYDLQLRSAVAKDTTLVVEAETPEQAQDMARERFPNTPYVVSYPFTEV